VVALRFTSTGSLTLLLPRFDWTPTEACRTSKIRDPERSWFQSKSGSSSFSNSRDNAAFPALWAAVAVGKNVADCSTALDLPAR
jgi:hypothetical protein